MFVYSCLKALTLQSAVLLSCQCNTLFLLWVSLPHILYFFPCSLFLPWLNTQRVTWFRLSPTFQLFPSHSSLRHFDLSAPVYSTPFVQPCLVFHFSISVLLSRGCKIRCFLQIRSPSSLGNILLAQTCSETGGIGLKVHILHSKWTGLSEALEHMSVTVAEGEESENTARSCCLRTAPQFSPTTLISPSSVKVQTEGHFSARIKQPPASNWYYRSCKKAFWHLCWVFTLMLRWINGTHFLQGSINQTWNKWKYTFFYRACLCVGRRVLQESCSWAVQSLSVFYFLWFCREVAPQVMFCHLSLVWWEKQQISKKLKWDFSFYFEQYLVWLPFSHLFGQIKCIWCSGNKKGLSSCCVLKVP